MNIARRGFSLLEALVAVAILALSMPALLWTFATAFGRDKAALERLERVELAERLAAMAALRFKGEFGSASGAEAGLPWTVETFAGDEKGAKQPPFVPVRVKVSVARSPAYDERFELETMFLYRGQRR